MAINYASLKATTTRLIMENGVAGTLTRETDAGYDPLADTGTPATESWPVFTVLTVARDGSDIYDIQSLPGTYEIGQLSVALISGEALPAGIVPQPGDRLLITGGQLWAVVGNNPTRPNADPIIHTCFVSIE